MGMSCRDIPVGSWRFVNAKERKIISGALENDAAASTAKITYQMTTIRIQQKKTRVDSAKGRR